MTTACGGTDPPPDRTAGIERAKKKGKYKGRADGALKGNPGRVVGLRDKGLTAPEVRTALGVSLRTDWHYSGRGPNQPVKTWSLSNEGHQVSQWS